MNDMSSVIVPKSDQINADTLLAGPMTVTIREVTIHGGQEQPVSILLEETPLAYRPCKSMSRVLVQAWGADAKAYVGRTLTLYRDPSVKWGGLEVGGIRISHMSDIDGKKVMQLTATKGQRKPHVVMPLVVQRRDDPPAQDGATKWSNAYLAAVRDAATIADLNTFANSKATKLAELQGARADLHTRCVEALDQRRAELAPKSDGFDDDLDDGDPFAGDVQEGPADEQRGESNNDADQPAYLAGIRDIRTKLAGAETLKAVEAISREWDNTLRVEVEEADNTLMLSVDRDINAKRRELRAAAEG